MPEGDGPELVQNYHERADSLLCLYHSLYKGHALRFAHVFTGCDNGVEKHTGILRNNGIFRFNSRYINKSLAHFVRNHKTNQRRQCLRLKEPLFFYTEKVPKHIPEIF